METNLTHRYGSLRPRLLLSHLEALARFGNLISSFAAANALVPVNPDRATGFIGDFDFGKQGVLKAEVVKRGQDFYLLPLTEEKGIKVDSSSVTVYEIRPENLFKKIITSNGFEEAAGSFSEMVGLGKRKVGSKMFHLFIFLDESLIIQPGMADWISSRIGESGEIILLKPSGNSSLPIGLKGVSYVTEIPTNTSHWKFDRSAYCAARFNTPVDEVFKIYPETTVFIDQQKKRIYVKGQDLDIKSDASVYKLIVGFCNLKGQSDSSENFAKHVLGQHAEEKQKKTFRDVKSRAREAIEKVLTGDKDCKQVLDRLFPEAGSGKQGQVFTHANENEFLTWV